MVYGISGEVSLKGEGEPFLTSSSSLTDWHADVMARAQAAALSHEEKVTC